MEAAEALNPFVSRPEKQVIAICQDNLGIQVGFEITLCEAFEAGMRAYRHENRRLYRAVSRVKHSGASTRNRALSLNFEAESGHLVPLCVTGMVLATGRSK